MATTTLRAAYAKYLLNEQLVKKYNALHGTNKSVLPAPVHSHLFASPDTSTDYDQAICIVGAGPAGLSAAIMLQYIGFKNITIYEASSRVGGRVYTYTFQNGPDCKHNYYDVGAMRLPHIDTQKSTFNMINWLNKDQERVPLKPYIYSADNEEPNWYEWPDNTDSGFDAYMQKLLSDQGFPLGQPGLALPDPGLSKNEAHTVTPAQGKKNFVQAFWDFVGNPEMQPDQYSTRAWLMTSPHGPKWNFEQTQVAQTFDTSTGLFDQAFMETICDWFDFSNAKTTPWSRVDGGMSVLTDVLCDVAAKHEYPAKLLTKSPILAMQENENTIAITYKNASGTTSSEEYQAVFNTTTLGCLQQMDLSGLQSLSPDNICAIRSLSYDRATKVAIKFSKPWWRDLIPNGGVSNTDLCVGNVVYPSWDDGDTAHTIIVSYTWAQDATRMAALIPTNDEESTNAEEHIIQLCLRDLAMLWTKKTKYPQTVETLQSLYCSHHAFAWSHDPNTVGAFALFGPGQFEYLYKQFTVPLCGNKLSICGEAISAHHAWISGAFDSSYNAVLAWCAANNYEDAAKKLEASPFALGEDKNTAEFDPKLFFWNLKLAQQESQGGPTLHTQ